MTSPLSSPETVVVAGGGFAGLFSALAVHERLPERPVMVIEPRDRFLFQPLLYELLSGELQGWEVAPTYRQLLSSRGICWLQDSVSGIDLDNQKLTTAAGHCVDWGDLVLATGTKLNDFGVPGVREHACGFRDLNDVKRLRALVKDLKKRRPQDAAVAIVGAGPTGVELACKLADMLEGAARIHLIEMGDRILPNSASFNRERAAAALERREVCLHLNTAVTAVHADRVRFKDGGVLPHSGLIWSAGSSPTLPDIHPSSARPNAPLNINQDLRLLDHQRVFALGDCGRCSLEPWPATAQVAMQQGVAVAKALEAIGHQQEPEPFQFQDRGEMLSLGIGDATLTGLGITLAGPLAFKIRRATYLTRLPGLSLGLRSAGAWLLSR
ncbi:MAG: 3-hydroxyacyl-CoA dehydrogenase [Cyanobium sp. RS427]|jgi:NADH dehydrogenase|nr:3-hydroxyacyl-CoA dehydrogenase [Cyanobium sp. RS427]|tara:strand:- start:2327 stop:3475 length:1149 start_codon:yes stop_codon:yes gene_type:complete